MGTHSKKTGRRDIEGGGAAPRIREPRFLEIGRFAAGLAGVLVILLAAIETAVQVYQNPGAFLSFPADQTAGLVFLGLFAAVFLLVWIWRGRLLLGIICLALLALLLAPPLLAGIRLAFLGLALVWACAVLLGERILAWVLPQSPFSFLESSALSAASGLAALSLLMLGLGLAGGYYPQAAWGLLAVLSAACLPGYLRRQRAGWGRAWAGLRGAWKGADLRLAAGVLGLGLICLAGAYIWAIAPSIHWDALNYHLSAAQLYTEAHRLVPMVENSMSTVGHYSTMIYTLAFLLQGQPLAGLVYFGCVLLVLLLTFLLGRRLLNPRMGALAALLLVAAPFFSFQASMTYNEFFVGLFFLAGVFFAYLWIRQGGLGLLGLSGAMAGFALGTKLSAADLCLVGSLVVLIFLYRRHRLGRQFWGGLALFGGLMAAFLLPWLVRDYLWTGSPITPLYPNIFPPTDWYPVPGGVSGPVPTKNYLTLLWDLTANCGLLCKESPGGAMGALPLLFLPWLYLSWKGFAPGARRGLAVVCGFALPALYLFFYISGSARYFILGYPILSLLGAANLEAAWEGLSAWAAWRRPALAVGLLLGFAYLFSSRLAVTVNYWMLAERYPLAYFLGQESGQEYLSKNLYTYPAFQFLNRQGDGVHKVLSLGNELRMYSHSYINGPAFSVEARRIMKTAASPADLARQLAEKGYDYLLVYGPGQERFPWFYTSPALNDEFYRGYTRLEFEAHATRLYRFYPQGVERGGDANLLRNPGFEGLDGQNWPQGWAVLGPAVVEKDSARAHSGLVGLSLAGPSVSVLYQDVPVSAGGLFSLGYWVKAPEAGRQLQLMVDWLDGNKALLQRSASQEELSAGSWSYSSALAQPPAGARFARFYLSLSTPGAAWFDDVCFGAGDACLYP